MKISKTKLLTGLLAAGMLFGLGAQNMVENSSFENGVSLWAPPSWKRTDNRTWLYPSADKANSQGAGGTASMKLDWKKDNICYVWYQKEFPLNGMKELELSFWAKSTGYDDVHIVAIVVSYPEIKDNKLKLDSLATRWNRPPKEWTYYSKKVKVPEGATKAKLYINIHGFKSTKGTSWLDDVYFGPVRKADGQQAKK